MSFNPTFLNFGSEAVGSSTNPRTVTLTNTGRVALSLTNETITGANAGDFAIEANTCGSTLAARASCSVSLTFTPSANGSRSANLSFADSAPASPQTVPLSGAGTEAPAVLLSPTSVAFPNTMVLTSSSPQSVTLTNTGNATLTVSAVTIGGTNLGDFSQSNNCTSVAASGTCTINVTFTPTAAGTRSASISFADNASGSPQTVPVSGTGTTAPTVSLSPASLTFPSTTVNQSSSAQAITLTNTGNASLTISGITITGANTGDFSKTTTCASSLAANASCAISVIFTPTAAGSRSASISFADNASGSPQAIPVSGTGTTMPAVSLSPASLSFPNTTVLQSSSAQTITLTNTGNASLALSSIAIAGANAGDFSKTTTCGGTLAANASCTISITFTPTAAGARAASIGFADNASGSPQAVPVSGTGVNPTAPAVSLAPASLTFGSVAVGSSSTPQAITLTNTGTATLNISGIAITGTNAADFSKTTTCGSTLAAAANCTITVTFTPTATGTRTASASITDNATGSPQTVPLSGGGAATVALSASSLTFAQQLVYPDAPPLTAPQTVTLTNNGTTALTISSLALAGTDPGDYILQNNCLASIPAGGTCTFSVQFYPTAAGSRPANVTIADNALGAPQTVTLSGTGSAGTNYYVAPNGSDSNNGTSLATPWATLHHAALVAFQPGSIINVRGGMYLNQTWQTFSGNGLSPAMPAVLRAYPGEVPVLTGNGSSSILNITGGSGIVDGIHIEDVNVSDAIIVSSAGAAIVNCTFRNSSGQWMRIDAGASSVIAQNNSFDSNGFLFTDGENDGIVIDGAQRVLIQNNWFTRCGHYCVDGIFVTATNNQNIIVRDNSIAEYWGGGIEAGGEIPATQELVEGNRISHVGEGVHYPKDGLDDNATNLIVRGNIFTNTGAWFSDSTIGLLAEKVPSDTDTGVQNNHIFGNDIYNDGPDSLYIEQSYDFSNSYVEQATNNWFVNNLIYQGANQLSFFGRSECPNHTVWCAFTPQSTDSWTNFPNANYTYNNDLDGTASNTAEWWGSAMIGTNAGYTLATLQSTYSAFFGGNIQANPLFNSPGSAVNGDFRLQGTSPAIATGRHLTQTSAAGTNTVTVPVNDAGYFMNGYGLTPGDLVLVGANPAVRVTAVDYVHNALTVGSAISFPWNANVDLANFNGAAPDMGAVPYSATVPNLSSISASSVSGTQETISFASDVPATGQIEFGPTTDYGRTSTKAAALTTSHSIALNNLEPGKTYHFAVVSLNAANGRAVSSDLTFTTASASGPTISNVLMSTVSVSGGLATATISWTTSTRANSQVFYSAAGAVMSYVHSTAISDAGGVTSHSVSIFGLALNTSYQYRVESTDVSTGATAFSPQSMLITPSSGAAGPVFSNISIAQVLGPEYFYSQPPSQTGYGSSNSVGTYLCCGYDYLHSTFAWSSSENVTGVGVNFQTNVGAGGEGALHAILSAANQGVPVSGNPAATISPQITLYYLPPNSAMVFQITGTDGGSNTTISPWMYWLTPAEDLTETPTIPPQSYFSETARSITTSGATIAWTMPQPATCALEYGTDTTYGSTASNGSGTSCSVTLSGLTSGTTYHMALTPVNSAGMSFTGQDFTFTTALNASNTTALNATNFGASPAQWVSDGAMTSGAPILTSTTASFQNSDIGQPAYVLGVGPSGGPLATTISSVNNSHSVNLAANASTTSSGQSVVWGPDSTSSIQSLINSVGSGGIICFPTPSSANGIHRVTNTGGNPGLTITNSNVRLTSCDSGFPILMNSTVLYTASQNDQKGVPVLYVNAGTSCGAANDVITGDQIDHLTLQDNGQAYNYGVVGPEGPSVFGTQTCDLSGTSGINNFSMHDLIINTNYLVGINIDSYTCTYTLYNTTVNSSGNHLFYLAGVVTGNAVVSNNQLNGGNAVGTGGPRLGIALKESNVTLTNNQISHVQFAGIELGESPNIAVSNTTLTNNSMTNMTPSGTACIFVSWEPNTMASGNSCANSSNAAFMLWTSKAITNSTIENNSCTSCNGFLSLHNQGGATQISGTSFENNTGSVTGNAISSTFAGGTNYFESNSISMVDGSSAAA